ncbi:MAG: DUF3881 family protein [Lachnospiraceae bacterium]|nr:hypothetical protein C807_03469 [Lachnospiraceae bacterium 28-4]MCX4375369.1 DUF3881 family protein [Lachnospiraceae bacterium]
MHRYMRAIGFSELKDRKELQNLITDIIVNADERTYTSKDDDTILAEFCKDFAENIGIAVCGEFDSEDKFSFDYYYPYLRGSEISSEEDVSVERHAGTESYAGICDDIKVGVSLIFYLQNMIPYVKAHNSKKLPVIGTTVTLSALSLQGKIMMPIIKNEKDKKKIKKVSNNRNSLIAAARKGDEEAIESLTLEDMDTYTVISKKIQKEDVFTLVDTYFMPYGVECDHYSILGEILDCNKVTNKITSEVIYQMTVNCNDLVFSICINEKDLYGEPQVGRRFKGSIWMQGYINFPEGV